MQDHDRCWVIAAVAIGALVGSTIVHPDGRLIPLTPAIFLPERSEALATRSKLATGKFR